ncbi:hypothetical protein CIT292_09892 [Citrobacter youngae ATCC 29220]|uniref:Uncharacterized protein n=1 Tax=Citrobacter youngae ATCC 29220 TaxID=500640 RepID=D4BH85_9ENTR|nr:hypothetical protein CIT292_09892 [Citrobacter youngae ATCC 29220]
MYFYKHFFLLTKSTALSIFAYRYCCHYVRRFNVSYLLRHGVSHLSSTFLQQ